MPDYDSYLRNGLEPPYSLKVWVLGLGEGNAMATSRCLKLVLAILLVFVSALAVQAQSSDEQSLGSVARNQREKKTAAKVIDDDEMVRRGFAHSSAKVPFDCNTECMAKAKPLAYWNFRNATERQWQDAFASAIADLSQDDWGRRLSEIREEMCRNPGDVDSKPLKALEEEMFSKLHLETRSKHIDDMAVAHPNDAVGAEAQRQLRVEDLKNGILEAKVELIQHSCSLPAKVPGK
jgi:hypothetical protein